MYFFDPLLNVYLLSSFTIIFGYFLDFTISEKTLTLYCKNNLDLYISGIKSTIINLLLISPINYIFAYNNYANLKMSLNHYEEAIKLLNIAINIANKKKINPINFMLSLANAYKSINNKHRIITFCSYTLIKESATYYYITS